MFLSPKFEGIQLNGFSLPVDAKEELLSKFTEKQDGAKSKPIYTLSTRMKDKIRLHLFVVTLILDDFIVDCQSLQKDLQLNTTKLVQQHVTRLCIVQSLVTCMGNIPNNRYQVSLYKTHIVHLSRVMDFYKALGCTVSKMAVKRKALQSDDEDELSTPTQSTSSCTAVLKIPLNFPKPRTNKQSRH